MLNLFIYLLTLFVQLMLGVFLFDHICKRKKSFVLTLLCYYTAFSGIHLLSVAEKDINTAIITGAKILLSYAVLRVFFDAGRLKALLCLVEFTVLQALVELPSLMLVNKLLNYNVMKDYTPTSNSVYISAGRVFLLNQFLLMVLLAVVIHTRKQIKSFRELADYLMIAAFDMIHGALLMVYYHTNSDSITELDNLIQLILQTLVFTLLIIQYFNIRRTRKLMTDAQELKMLRAETDNNYSYYRLADEKFDQITKLRQDLREQISSVKPLFGTQDGRLEAERIMDEIGERLNSIKVVNYCGNKTINAVLTFKLNEKRVEDIDTQILLEDCGGLTVSDYDICSLVSNLFDNAVESCLRAQTSEHPFIEMRSSRQNDYFVIRVTNTCCDETAGSSFKGIGHGYGLKIIEDICRRHSGEFIFERKDNVVTSIACLREVAE